jgi:signal peptidase II
VKRRLGRSATLAIFAIGILVVAALDKLTKSLAVEALADGSVRPFIPGLLDFRLVYNTGAAWGIFEGARMLFLIIAIAALAAILAYLLLAKRCALLEVIGLSLVAGGAIGNAIDRAQMGQVVDFIHTLFIDFPLFNLADSAITLGVILFIFFLLFGGRANARAGRSQERG